MIYDFLGISYLNKHSKWKAQVRRAYDVVLKYFPLKRKSLSLWMQKFLSRNLFVENLHCSTLIKHTWVKLWKRKPFDDWIKISFECCEQTFLSLFLSVSEKEFKRISMKLKEKLNEKWNRLKKIILKQRLEKENREFLNRNSLKIDKSFHSSYSFESKEIFRSI